MWLIILLVVRVQRERSRLADSTFAGVFKDILICIGGYVVIIMIFVRCEVPPPNPRADQLEDAEMRNGKLSAFFISGEFIISSLDLHAVDFCAEMELRFSWKKKDSA
jgi:hypothetical protein